MSESAEKKAIIWASAVVGIISVGFLALGVPVINAKMIEISDSTRLNAAQKVQIEHLKKSNEDNDLSIKQIQHDLTKLIQTAARIDERTARWEPEK